MRESIVWLRRLVFEYGSSPPISLDLCADDEDPSQLIIRPGWDAPHVRCFSRTFCAWPCLLRQVGTVLGSLYDYVVAGLAYANPGSRQKPSRGLQAPPIQQHQGLPIAAQGLLSPARGLLSLCKKHQEPTLKRHQQLYQQ